MDLEITVVVGERAVGRVAVFKRGREKALGHRHPTSLLLEAPPATKGETGRAAKLAGTAVGRISAMRDFGHEVEVVAIDDVVPHVVAGAAAGGSLAGAAHQQKAGGEVALNQSSHLGGRSAVVAALQHVEEVAGGAAVVGEGLGRAGIVVVKAKRRSKTEGFGSGEALALRAFARKGPVAFDPGGAAGGKAVLLAQPLALRSVGAPVLLNTQIQELGARQRKAGAPQVEFFSRQFGRIVCLKRVKNPECLHHRRDEELAVVIGRLAIGNILGAAIHGAHRRGNQIRRTVVREQRGGGESKVGRGVLNLGVVVGITDGSVVHVREVRRIEILEAGYGANDRFQMIK